MTELTALPPRAAAPAALPAPRVEPVTAPYAALLLRVGLGAVYLAHGLFKLAVLGLPATAEFFAAHGFPGWTAYPVTILEIGGGLLLLAGLYTREAALGLLPVAAGALLVHLPNGWYFAVPNGGWEYVAFLGLALLAQSALGDGAWSLGRVLARRSGRRVAAIEPG